MLAIYGNHCCGGSRGVHGLIGGANNNWLSFNGAAVVQRSGSRSIIMYSAACSVSENGKLVRETNAEPTSMREIVSVKTKAHFLVGNI